MVQEWLTYLKETENMKISVTMAGKDGEVQFNFEHLHRWKDHYKAMTLAKLYRLEAMADKNAPYTLLTLTTYQEGGLLGGYSLEESFEILRKYGTALMDIIRKIRPGVQYLWVFEPHASGFPHRHCIIQAEFTDEEKARIQNLWSNVYRAGSAEHGINFEIRNSHESLKSLRNYVMAYLGKSMRPVSLTPGEAVYHTVAWARKIRFWGASQGFSAMMRNPCAVWYWNTLDRASNALVWVKTELLLPNGEVAPIRAARDKDIKPAPVSRVVIHEDLGIAAAEKKFHEDCIRQSAWEREREKTARANPQIIP